MPLAPLSEVKRFMSHPLSTLRAMEPTPNIEIPEPEPMSLDMALCDPVAYLASFGIGAELVIVVPAPMAPAA